MSETASSDFGSTTARSPRRVPGVDEPTGPEVDPETILSVLSDEYTRDIVTTIDTKALPATEIADRLDISRATVYRRLNRLKEAGLLETAMTYDPHGNHRQRFRVTLDRVTLSLDDGAIAVDDITRTTT